MSAHLDLFIKCDLKPDVPQRVVDGIQYLTDPLFELTQSVETEGIWADFWKDWDKFLLNDPKFETFSDFRKEERLLFSKNQLPVYRYTLMYYGHHILDDVFAVRHLPFVAWLAQYVAENFMGYCKEQSAKEPSLLYAKDFMPK